MGGPCFRRVTVAWYRARVGLVQSSIAQGPQRENPKYLRTVELLHLTATSYVSPYNPNLLSPVTIQNSLLWAD
jgi:hypothetical protein